MDIQFLHLFFSVMLVHISVVYVDNISLFGLSYKKVSNVLVRSSIFLLFEKMDQTKKQATTTMQATCLHLQRFCEGIL